MNTTRMSLLLSILALLVTADPAAARTTQGEKKVGDGLIAYSVKTGIHVVRRNGKGHRRLIPWHTKRCGRSCEVWLVPRHPRWSPDGRSLTYHVERFVVRRGMASEDPRRSRVMVARANGRKRRFLAKGHDPTWSPDGREVIFAVNPGDRSLPDDPDLPGVKVYEPEEVPMRAIDVRTGARRMLPVPGWPEFSPDGTRMVFRHATVMGIDGSNPREFRMRGIYATPARWNRDGLISWHCRTGTFAADICVLDPDTGKRRRVRRTKRFLEQEMASSPTGRWYAVAALHGLYVVRANGKRFKLLLSNNPGGVPVPSNTPTSPDWQPVTRR